MPNKPEYDERGEPKQSEPEPGTSQPKGEQSGAFDPRFPPEGGWGEPEPKKA